MHKLKSHRTVEQIAKKHRMDVSFIQKQLDIGEPIEHEHTKDHELAMDIALQHLDEIPDYYTRLKKMEADAKKHHKKFKDVTESAISELESGLKKLSKPSYDSIDGLMKNIMKKHDMSAKELHNSFVEKHNKTPDAWIKKSHVKEQSINDGALNYDWDYPINPEKTRYCPKCKKDETREECQYGSRYWDLFSLPSKLKDKNDFVKEEGLRDWFGKSKSSDGKSGWVNVVTGGTCASDEPGEGTPKCVSSAKRASMTPAERLSAARRKKAEDPGQQQKTGAAKPTYVSTDSPKKKMKEEMEVQEAKDKPGKGSGKKDACYNKVKSRYDVWPSAYASGALVKCRKVGAANWGTKSEETMHEEERYCPLCDKRETRSECSYGEKAWDKVSVKDEEYSMARSELKTIEDAVKRLKAKVGKGEGDLEAWVQSKITKAADYIDTAADYIASGEMEEQKLVDKILDDVLSEKCWPGYKKKGMKTMFGKRYPNCVKVEDVTIEDADGNTFAEVVDLIKPEPIKGFKSQVDEATRLQAQTGNVVAVTLMWRGKYYSLRMFFPQIKTPSRQEINDELQKVYPGSRVVYHTVSEFTSGEPIIQAFGPQGGSLAKPGPSKAYVKPYGEQVELEEEGPSLSVGRGEKLPVSRGGGLTAKGREKYNRETGSNLQAPVTGDVKPGSKAAKRRKNFCSRSRSWKGERGLAARRRWKC